ncbi:hypothetical protein REPUB_Repub05bG0154800 [Reevesia pubescens]
MDSHKFLGGKRIGYSKAQMCLQKILTIIGSIPPHQYPQNSKLKPSFHHHLQVFGSSSSNSNSQDKAQLFGPVGFHNIDLNLELTSSSPETENSSIGIDISMEAKSNQEKYAKEENSFDEKRNPVSETEVEDEKKETEPFRSREFEQEEGSLSLATEAGELSSENGELGTQDINVKETMEEGRECRVVDLYARFDEVSQVVRTKRGRKRVLPCRYKDSVLQPLARNSGSRKRQRFKVFKSVNRLGFFSLRAGIEAASEGKATNAFEISPSSNMILLSFM